MTSRLTMWPAAAHRHSFFMRCELFHSGQCERAAILAAMTRRATQSSRAADTRHAYRIRRQRMRHIRDAARWTAPCRASLLIALLAVLSACATSTSAPRAARREAHEHAGSPTHGHPCAGATALAHSRHERHPATEPVWRQYLLS